MEVSNYLKTDQQRFGMCAIAQRTSHGNPDMYLVYEVYKYNPSAKYFLVFESRIPEAQGLARASAPRPMAATTGTGLLYAVLYVVGLEELGACQGAPHSRHGARFQGVVPLDRDIPTSCRPKHPSSLPSPRPRCFLLCLFVYHCATQSLYKYLSRLTVSYRCRYGLPCSATGETEKKMRGAV